MFKFIIIILLLFFCVLYFFVQVIRILGFWEGSWGVGLSRVSCFVSLLKVVSVCFVVGWFEGFGDSGGRRQQYGSRVLVVLFAFFRLWLLSELSGFVGSFVLVVSLLFIGSFSVYGFFFFSSFLVYGVMEDVKLECFAFFLC